MASGALGLGADAVVLPVAGPANALHAGWAGTGHRRGQPRPAPLGGLLRPAVRRRQRLAGIQVEAEHQAVIVRRGRDNGVRLPGLVKPCAARFECRSPGRVRVAPACPTRVIQQEDLAGP